MKTSEKIAKAIRVFTIPPVFVGLLLIGCLVRGGRDFAAPWLFAAVFFFQVLAPTLAYPIQLLVPRLKAQGRDGQRRLAFILTAVGYTLSFICSLVFSAGKELLFITAVYFSAALLLAVVNKFNRVKASGHACSSIGTMVCMIRFFGPAFIAPYALIAAATMWASLKLGRHTAPEFILGAAIGVAAFLICGIIIL